MTCGGDGGGVVVMCGLLKEVALWVFFFDCWVCCRGTTEDHPKKSEPTKVTQKEYVMINYSTLLCVIIIGAN